MAFGEMVIVPCLLFVIPALFSDTRTFYGKIAPALAKRTKGKMAHCESCGKTTAFGQSRSFSMKATKRKFKPNLQRVRVLEEGRLVRRTLCTKCIKRLSMP
ncbi:MAG: 50S ribosomal protein L28 [Anaerolineales bacterium]